MHVELQYWEEFFSVTSVLHVSCLQMNCTLYKWAVEPFYIVAIWVAQKDLVAQYGYGEKQCRSNWHSQWECTDPQAATKRLDRKLDTMTLYFDKILWRVKFIFSNSLFWFRIDSTYIKVTLPLPVHLHTFPSSHDNHHQSTLWAGLYRPEGTDKPGILSLSTLTEIISMVSVCIQSMKEFLKTLFDRPSVSVETMVYIHTALTPYITIF